MPVPGRSPAAPGAGTTLRWLERLQAELESSVSDQGGGQHSEVLFKKQEGYKPETYPSMQPLLHSKMASSQICNFLKIKCWHQTHILSHVPS